MKKKDHLPVYGVGPICVYLMVGLLIAGLVLRHFGFLDSGEVTGARPVFWVIGGLLIAFGIYMWIKAVIIAKVGDAILNNQLVTTGVYSWVRNPIYSAIALALTGIALLFANLWLLILPVLFWLDITLMMKFTEEKWLLGVYGEDYRAYCKKVNRCIPWFPKKENKR